MNMNAEKITVLTIIASTLISFMIYSQMADAATFHSSYHFTKPRLALELPN